MAGGYCDVHRFRHGPQGCPLCRRSEATSSPLRRGALVGAILLVASTLGGLALWTRFSTSDRAVDPEPHRAALRKLETILYRPAPPEPEDRKAIEDAAAALAKEVGARRGARAREAALAVAAFSETIGGRGEERFETVHLGDARAEWEGLRGRHFAPATWLSESTPFLDQAQRWGEPRPPSAAALERSQEAEFVLEQMSGIVDRAEVYLEGPAPCSEAADYERAADEWDNWKRSHENDVARAKDSLDPRYGPALSSAFRALLALSAPLKGGPCNPTLNNDNRVRVSRARAMLSQARASIERMKTSG